MCLKALSHLCRDIPGRRCKGQVIFNLAHFFTRALDQIHNLCVVQMSTRPDYSASYRDARRNDRISAVITEYSAFLANILTSPEFHKPSLHHSEVLEGLFAGLLDRIGRLMSQIVFKRPLTLSTRPGRIDSPDNDPSFSQTNELVIHLEGETLASTLKQVVASEDESGTMTLAEVLAKANCQTKNSSSETLLDKARARLQKTLLKGTFGEDGDDFKDSLKIPKRPEGHIDIEPAEAEPTSTSSFIEAMCSIVGWEILLTS